MPPNHPQSVIITASDGNCLSYMYSPNYLNIGISFWVSTTVVSLCQLSANVFFQICSNNISKWFSMVYTYFLKEMGELNTQQNSKTPRIRWPSYHCVSLLLHVGASGINSGLPSICHARERLTILLKVSPIDSKNDAIASLLLKGLPHLHYLASTSAFNNKFKLSFL